MILAAADYATGDTAPPPELLEFIDCRLFNSLPYAGGWKQQPMRWIKRVSLYHEVYYAYKTNSQAKRLKGKDKLNWQRENKNVLQMVKAVEGIRHGKHND